MGCIDESPDATTGRTREDAPSHRQGRATAGTRAGRHCRGDWRRRARGQAPRRLDTEERGGSEQPVVASSNCDHPGPAAATFRMEGV